MPASSDQSHQAQREVQYELHQLGLGRVRIDRVEREVVGEFDDRAAARQHMIDTTEKRRLRDVDHAHVDSFTLYAATCSKCDQWADDDGGECRATPEEAIEHVLEMHDWAKVGDELLCSECRPAEDDLP